MKFPADVEHHLRRSFKNNHRLWLTEDDSGDQSAWPLKINLGIPGEKQARSQLEQVRHWVKAWQAWQGDGTLHWCERHWPTLGTQRLPDRLVLDSPLQVAAWIGAAKQWQRVQQRYRQLLQRWPQLHNHLPRHYRLLADYSTTDYQRLLDVLDWLNTHPASNLYPRQLPIAGLDSKWLEKRQTVLAQLFSAIRATASDNNPLQCCGLKPLPRTLRLRILDAKLRQQFSGLEDITAPLDQLATLTWQVDTVFIVENLQTGLAFTDLPGTVVIMQLGYAVDALAHLPWLSSSDCIYWGDLDSHGLAILSHARSSLPRLTSLMMDSATLLAHRPLWGEEHKQHSATILPHLTPEEQVVYQGIKNNTWGRNIRLEQERICWDYAWDNIRRRVTA